MVERYGALWPTTDDLRIEMNCIIKGGQWLYKDGEVAGLGLFHHYKQMALLLWPEDDWCEWDDMILEECVKATCLGIAGSASSRKTSRVSRYVLCLYWCFPDETTVLCSTTTREKLDSGIWAEIKQCFRRARERYPWLAGNFIESKQLITTDSKEVEGRDFRNGLKGVACRKGDKWEGLGNYIGIKNKIVVLAADEAQLMEPGFFDVSVNLSSNAIGGRFQLIATGNPNDTLNSFGKLCEPVGGWEVFEQGKKTETWSTKYRNGRCLRLVGTDSPNTKLEEGQKPFNRLIDQSYINDIASTYGTEDWKYLMWVLARFPTGALASRVITRHLCTKFKAFEPPVWSESKLVRLLALDVAYGSSGGDRTIAGEWAYGRCQDGKVRLALVHGPILVKVSGLKGLPEDQIASWIRNYCEDPIRESPIPPTNVFYDGTGRSSLTSALARVWSPYVVPLEFGGRATERPCPVDPRKQCKEMYGKFVSELWFAWRACIEADQMRGLTDSIVEEGQMRAYGKKNIYTQTAGEDVEPKEETKLRLGRSPDEADMVVCAVEGARRLGMQLAKLDSGKTQEKENVLHKMAEEWAALWRKKELRVTG